MSVKAIGSLLTALALTVTAIGLDSDAPSTEQRASTPTTENFSLDANSLEPALFYLETEEAIEVPYRLDMGTDLGPHEPASYAAVIALIDGDSILTTRLVQAYDGHDPIATVNGVHVGEGFWGSNGGFTIEATLSVPAGRSVVVVETVGAVANGHLMLPEGTKIAGPVYKGIGEHQRLSEMSDHRIASELALLSLTLHEGTRTSETRAPDVLAIWWGPYLEDALPGTKASCLREGAPCAHAALLGNDTRTYFEFRGGYVDEFDAIVHSQIVLPLGWVRG